MVSPKLSVTLSMGTESLGLSILLQTGMELLRLSITLRTGMESPVSPAKEDGVTSVPRAEHHPAMEPSASLGLWVPLSRDACPLSPAWASQSHGTEATHNQGMWLDLQGAGSGAYPWVLNPTAAPQESPPRPVCGRVLRNSKRNPPVTHLRPTAGESRSGGRPVGGICLLCPPLGAGKGGEGTRGAIDPLGAGARPQSPQ